MRNIRKLETKLPKPRKIYQKGNQNCQKSRQASLKFIRHLKPSESGGQKCKLLSVNSNEICPCFGIFRWFQYFGQVGYPTDLYQNQKFHMIFEKSCQRYPILLCSLEHNSEVFILECGFREMGMSSIESIGNNSPF